MDYRRWFPAVHILRIIIVLHGLLVPANNAEFNLPLLAIEKLAETFGQKIYELSSQVTALTDLRTDYLLMEPEVRPLDGHWLVRNLKHALENQLIQKEHVIKKLEMKAEEAHMHHLFDPDLKITYPESKKLNVTEFELVRNEHFNNISVNLTMSTVHVPTNVYDQSAEVLNGIAWTDSLDETFRRNFEKDQSLTWQYFCSTTGFLRMYPGTVWHRDRTGLLKPDVFDCRLRKWYIQAATTPKDIVIVLDSSGSMKGPNFEIAKETARLIIDTLTENDYFNVITFSDVPEYLDPCSNGTLIHANTANKRRMMSAFDPLKAAGTAFHELALQEAFELLALMNLTSRGSLCNRAILFITDGVTKTFDEVFAKYNQPVLVRLFTYLIGNGNKDHSANMKAIACNNKGYFSHIRSLVGVHEHIQDYLRVLSRPLVLSRADHTIWTNVYDDTVGLDLVVTVARPVFDMSNNPGTEGKLLGVVGTDIKISEIEDIIRQYVLGVNGYAFVLTNNGYVISHPELRPKHKNALNPNHDIVDLYKLEQSSEVRQLLKRMLDRDSGSMRMKSYLMYDSMKRVMPRENHYYFTDLYNTPFSLALSLPSEHGRNLTKTVKELPDIDLSSLRIGDPIIAPWTYCKFDPSEQNQNPVEVLIKYLSNRKWDHHSYRERCNDELIRSFLFDAEATRGAHSSWMKENWDESSSDSGSLNLKKRGVELVFIGTIGGLTRYLPLVYPLTDPEFIESQRSTIDSLYYRRAVENGEEMFTFSLPFDSGKMSDLDKIMVTGSTPIFVNRDSHEAVVAVVGLQMKYTQLFELLMNSSQLCSGNEIKCKLCNSEEMDCYLLDYNGYIVLSENPKELGLFYGELDGIASMLIKDMTINDSATQPSLKKGVFRRIQINDYQGVCEILRKTNSGSHAAFMNPFKLLFESFMWLIHEISLVLLGSLPGYGFNGYGNVTDSMDIEQETISYPGADDIDSDSFDSLVADLMKVASIEQVYRWKDECIRKMPNGDMAFLCLKDILRMYEPGITGYKPCIKSYTHYIANPSQLPQVGTLFTCDVCEKSFSINLIPRTNLMLLAVDSVCYCNSEPVMSSKPVEINLNDSVMCQAVQEDTYRQRLSHCYAHHQDEEFLDCGRAGFLYPSLVTLLHLLSVSLLVGFC